ncbi:hypothetical protein SDC9_85046 [bioreactor metagenome]|uniref:Uncharacterized protein n=1 Tax=bioreactor metagenome TaxID=1076179 RepID=A0A644ZCK6_9ZZZZ
MLESIRCCIGCKRYTVVFAHTGSSGSNPDISGIINKDTAEVVGRKTLRRGVIGKGCSV